MPRINLLPWREAERQKRQKEFGIALGAGVVAAIGVVVVTMFFYDGMIDNQQRRNNRLTEEIKVLEEAIQEIDGLERQKERLLARMEIIEQLQKSRPEIVHLFDEMVRLMPDGVYLRGMSQNGDRIELRGVAQSSTRVSALMRQIDASDWLADPDVDRVVTTQSGTTRQSDFVVYLKQSSSTGAEDES